jgi:hypothetical protein
MMLARLICGLPRAKENKQSPVHLEGWIEMVVCEQD